MARHAALTFPRLSGDDDVGSAGRAVLRRATRSLARAVAGVRTGDAEGLHQLRVALRRLRVALTLFGPALGATPTLDRELSWLGRQTGTVRDIDVLAAALAHRARRLAGPWQEPLTPLVERLSTERSSAHAALLDVVRSPRAAAAMARAAALAEGGGRAAGTRALAAAAPDRMQPLLRAVRQAAVAAAAKPTPDALHRMRVRAKRVRYAAEILDGLNPTLSRLVRRLVRLQDLLGQHQDAITQIGWLTRYATDEDVPRPTLVAVGMLIAGLERRARRIRQKAPRQIDRLVRRLPRTLQVPRAAATDRRLRLVRAAGV